MIQREIIVYKFGWRDYIIAPLFITFLIFISYYLFYKSILLWLIFYLLIYLLIIYWRFSKWILFNDRLFVSFVLRKQEFELKVDEFYLEYSTVIGKYESPNIKIRMDKKYSLINDRKLLLFTFHNPSNKKVNAILKWANRVGVKFVVIT